MKVYIVVIGFHIPDSTSINLVSCSVPFTHVTLTSRMGVERSFEEQWGCIDKVVKEVAGYMYSELKKVDAIVALSFSSIVDVSIVTAITAILSRRAGYESLTHVPRPLTHNGYQCSENGAGNCDSTFLAL